MLTPPDVCGGMRQAVAYREKGPIPRILPVTKPNAQTIYTSSQSREIYICEKGYR